MFQSKENLSLKINRDRYRKNNFRDFFDNNFKIIKSSQTLSFKKSNEFNTVT